MESTDGLRCLEIYTGSYVDRWLKQGAWGALFIDNSNELYMTGGDIGKTGYNHAELVAAVKALELVDQVVASPKDVVVYSQSEYVVQGITSWIHQWFDNGWTTVEGGKVMHRNLWEQLHSLSKAYGCRWQLTPLSARGAFAATRVAFRTRYGCQKKSVAV